MWGSGESRRKVGALYAGSAARKSRHDGHLPQYSDPHRFQYMSMTSIHVNTDTAITLPRHEGNKATSDPRYNLFRSNACLHNCISKHTFAEVPPLNIPGQIKSLGMPRLSNNLEKLHGGEEQSTNKQTNKHIPAAVVGWEQGGMEF